ncbi:hypothetical protein TraAM80_09654 [Trypanosoma rangeli]|uniref:Uncharacterized protein n=1 Tax=Trypanosoma rangeli TaxID=5698 RepID=A0A3R7KAD1_TRYRA|nr:uncharacterized protein TraAM80_09654 [Trypanosoma rangeli]RNE96741.1 hypothetical protein TraAM80_09654 [Trypanosoma rangeli]|eukprot:RNE96741.1 hypothetical protein TraAM80_09654 [Trypanosoma rangeli]
MWRLQCALHGLPLAECHHTDAGRRKHVLERPYCGTASLVLDVDHGSGQCRDMCLLEASLGPDGKLLALHIEEERAEVREARPFTSSTALPHVNGHAAQLRLVLSADLQGACCEEAGENVSLQKNSPAYLHTSSWRYVNSAALLPNENDEPLLRLRRYDDFDPTVSVLSHDAVYQLQLDPLERTNFCGFGRTVINATSMDCWGPHSVVVGFSSGEVSLMDWRDPSGGPMVSAYTPQTTSTCRTARGRFGATPPHAGIMSCCALEDSFRVVCGLGDPCGTVVVTDLRKAVTASHVTRKHGRRSAAEDAWRAVIAGSVSIPTSYPISDMRHCRANFGKIGMVDTGGTSLLTTIQALEAGLISVRGKRDDASKKDILPFHAGPRVHSESSGTLTHSRSLRCDVSSEGRFLVSTRVEKGSIALLQHREQRNRLTLNAAAHEQLGEETFASVAFMGSIVCAQTDRGSALCTTLHP